MLENSSAHNTDGTDRGWGGKREEERGGDCKIRSNTPNSCPEPDHHTFDQRVFDLKPGMVRVTHDGF